MFAIFLRRKIIYKCHGCVSFKIISHGQSKTAWCPKKLPMSNRGKVERRNFGWPAAISFALRLLTKRE
jgi:hypothetical protein